MNVDQIMTQPLMSCSVEDTANQAAQVMWEGDIGAVAVLDAQGALAGIVTDRDLCMAAYTRGAPLAMIPVREVMSSKVTVVHGGDRLGVAEALMRSQRVRRLPVVDAQGTPIGLLSLNDVVRAAQQQRGKKTPEVLGDEVVATLGAISQPRRPTAP